MRKIQFILLFVLFGFITFAQDFPEKSTRLVNDFTKTLTNSQIKQLESKLVAFDDSTSNQITVVMLKSVGEYEIGDYALQLGRKWGVGGKTKNNGVVLLIALGDRKVTIQTGYGLEGVLPDIYTKRIIENDIKPYFKTGNYYEGIDAGINSIISLTKGEYKNDTPPKAKSAKSKGGIGAAFFLMIVIVVIAWFIKKGGNGGSGHVIGGRGVTSALLLSTLLSGRRGSSGGFSGGGDSGGFGGFGGGSFGGGGSSGSW